MMATNMDSDSEVHFKEKLEEKGIKAEATTIRFTFRVSTPATSPPGRGPEAQVGDDEEVQPPA